MGTKFQGLTRWTKTEDDIIRKLYPDGGIDACFGRLRKHNRTSGAIYMRAGKLGLRGKLTDLRSAAKEAIDSARFAGEALTDIESRPDDCHENSRCTVSLRAMLRLKAEVLVYAPPPRPTAIPAREE